MTTDSRFSRDRAASTTANGKTQLVVFRLDEQEFALPVPNIVQVVRMVAITHLPEAPDVIEGIINVRGRVVPVVNIRRRLGMWSKPRDVNTRLLIARHEGYMMALIVDTVVEVLTIPTEDIGPPPELESRVESGAVVGNLGDRMILILDPGKILLSDKQDHLERALADFDERDYRLRSATA